MDRADPAGIAKEASVVQCPDRAQGAAFLEGVRVLDVTGALAGPYCTTVLSDLGAEVIKIEPVQGDSMRRRLLGPERRALPFDMVHRDKGSLAIDLKAREGAAILKKLAIRSDVLVENFRAGAMNELGLGYEDLRLDCPDLVYCSISGFGQFGPMRDAKGIDLIAQAYGGLMSVTGSEDGQLAKAGFPLSDLGSAMWAAIGVLAGLMRARRGGGGAYIDVSLADTVAAWSVWEVADFIATGSVPEPLGTAHRLAAPYQAFDCADDRKLVIGAVERAWGALCSVLQIDLSDDSRFDTEGSRFRHRKALAELLQDKFSAAPRDEWIDKLRSAGVPCGPVNTIDSVLSDPQYGIRNMFPRNAERHGQEALVNTPIIADGAPRARGKAPQLGESTLSLLAELGYDHSQIADLAHREVLAFATAGVESGTPGSVDSVHSDR